MIWQLHWLEASGDLRPWRDRIAGEVEIARQAVAVVLPLPAIDVLVQRLAGAAIPETGMVGQAYRPNLISLTLDPDNPDFERAARRRSPPDGGTRGASLPAHGRPRLRLDAQ